MPHHPRPLSTSSPLLPHPHPRHPQDAASSFAHKRGSASPQYRDQTIPKTQAKPEASIGGHGAWCYQRTYERVQVSCALAIRADGMLGRRMLGQHASPSLRASHIKDDLIAHISSYPSMIFHAMRASHGAGLRADGASTCEVGCMDAVASKYASSGKGGMSGLHWKGEPPWGRR